MSEITANEARPLVSIIVPSYNQGRFLRETLDSILSQDYRPLEVLVMDGASKDETVEILREYSTRHSELRWWSERDSGVADAVNKGLALARGVYAGIQSSDDVYQPGAVRDAVEILRSRPELGIVCADMNIVDEAGRFVILAPARMPFTMARFLSRNTMIHQSSAFFRLELARAVGGWDPAYFCADTEMWLRMAFRAPVLKVDRVWSNWRGHQVQRNKDALRMWESWGLMMAQSKDLKRAPLQLRLAARAGRRMVALSYNPGRSWLFVTVQAWLAVLTYPPCFLGMIPKARLLPGLGRLRNRVRSLAAAPGSKRDLVK